MTMLLTALFLWKLLRTNLRLRSRLDLLQLQVSSLEGSCQEHNDIRQSSAGKVAETILALRRRVEDLEFELDEVQDSAGEADVQTAHLQTQLEEAHRVNAVSLCKRQELEQSLQSL